MFAEERQEEIARLVAQSRRVNGAELAKRFSVTMETVRRDLAVLEKSGKLRRVHGGAVSADQSTSGEQGIDSRQRINADEKRRIAARLHDPHRLLRAPIADVGAPARDELLHLRRAPAAERTRQSKSEGHGHFSVQASAVLASSATVDVVVDLQRM